MTHATTQMKLEDITLSETNQTNIVQFYLYKVARVVNLIVRENRMVAIRGWGEGRPVTGGDGKSVLQGQIVLQV